MKQFLGQEVDLVVNTFGRDERQAAGNEGGELSKNKFHM